MKNKKRFLVSFLPIFISIGVIGVTIPMTTLEAAEHRQYQYTISFDSNGGKKVNNVLYVNGDRIKLPTTTKYGYVFGGWYLDNNTFEQPFYPGSTEIDHDVTLFAKWVVKEVKVYLDSFYEDEFEPLIYNVGDTFKISSLPTSAKPKVSSGLSFDFEKWVTGNEQPVLEDFVLKDTYYEFHTTYGAPNTSSYECTYSSTFDDDYGYIDPDHSWLRGEMDLPATGVGQNDPLEAVFVDNGELVMSQLRHRNRGYSAKAALPLEFSQGKKEYTTSVRFRITDILEPNETEINAGDIGMGIMVGFNPTNGANIHAVFDAYDRTVRLAAQNKDYAKSTLDDVTGKFIYNLPQGFDVSEYHTLKVKYNGVTPSTSENLNASYVYVYLDDVECFNTKDVKLDKNWFFADQCTGDYTGLICTHVEARISDVKFQSYDEKTTYYEADFTTHKYDTFADGWRYLTNAPGGNVGNMNVSNGVLNVNTYFKNQTLLKNQTIYSPSRAVKNFIVKFDFKFNEYFEIDKYFALMFRGDLDAGYNAMIVRVMKGQMQLYKHGTTSSIHSDWGSATALKTVAEGFSTTWHSILFLLKENYCYLYLDGKQLYSNNIDQSALYNKEGYIGFLTSSANVSFDNLEIYDIDKEVK